MDCLTDKLSFLSPAQNGTHALILKSLWPLVAPNPAMETYRGSRFTAS